MTVAQRLACLEGASALGILGVSAVPWLPAAASSPGDFASPALVVLLTTLPLRVAVYALAKRPPFAERVVIIAVGALARELAEAGPGHGRAHSGPMTTGRAHSAHLLREGRNV
ncbi:MAG TPA: hypothetical protein VFR64_16545 [Methylomirabilota bacterium]|nr:hypothetical protein [Methylomirabilota bacterium]